MTMHLSPAAADAAAATEVGRYGPLLAALIAAKHELGFTAAWWAGCGPSLAASIALAGIALEEEGHARVLERLLAAGEDSGARNAIVRWDQWPSIGDPAALRSAPWPEALARQAALDLEVSAVLRGLGLAPAARLSACATRMEEEEEVHAAVLLDLLSEVRGPGAVLERVLRPELVGLVEALVRTGVLPSESLERLHAHAATARLQARARLAPTA